MELIKNAPAAKFDESVEMALNLGVDPKHADQMVRGALVLPHGVGKSVRVIVFAKGDKEKEAQEAYEFAEQSPEPDPSKLYDYTYAPGNS